MVGGGGHAARGAGRPRHAGEGRHRRARHRPLLGEADRRRDAASAPRRRRKAIVTVEDHSVCGGIGEAVAAAVAGPRAGSRSSACGRSRAPGKPAELLEAHGI